MLDGVDCMTNAAAKPAAGLDGLIGGVMIFLMMSLVLKALMAAAAAARTGGGGSCYVEAELVSLQPVVACEQR